MLRSGSRGMGRRRRGVRAREYFLSLPRTYLLTTVIDLQFWCRLRRTNSSCFEREVKRLSGGWAVGGYCNLWDTISFNDTPVIRRKIIVCIPYHLTIRHICESHLSMPKVVRQPRRGDWIEPLSREGVLRACII